MAGVAGHIFKQFLSLKLRGAGCKFFFADTGMTSDKKYKQERIYEGCKYANFQRQRVGARSAPIEAMHLKSGSWAE